MYFYVSFNISRYTSFTFDPRMISPSMTNSFLSLTDTRLVLLSISQIRLAFRTKLFGRVSRTTSGVLSVFVFVTDSFSPLRMLDFKKSRLLR